MSAKLAKFTAAVSILFAGTALAVPVDVIRLNANLTVRTDQNGGQNRQVALVNKRLINLAMNQPSNAPADPALRLGLTCEALPRLVVYNDHGDTVEATLATASIVEGGIVADDVVLDSQPFAYTLLRLTFYDTDATDDPVVGDVSGIDAGEVQVIYRSKSGDLANCKQAQLSTFSGWLSYHDTDPRNNQVQTMDPGVVIRGVANAVPPVRTVED